MLSADLHINSTRNSLLRALPDVFHNIDRIIVLSRFPSENATGLEMVRENNHYREQELYIDGLNELFTTEKERVVYAWILKDELPFEEKWTQGGQMNLFAEQEHVVLRVKVTSEQTKNSVIDIFYLFFREDQSNFGISRLDGIFDTSRKALVGSLLSKFILLYYEHVNVLRDDFCKFTNVTNKLFEQISLQNDNASLKEMMQQWANDFLENYPRPSGVEIHLSEKALDKLLEHDFKTARKTLENAAAYALMLHSGNGGDKIEIRSSYLLFDTAVQQTDKLPNKIISTIGSKKQKVMQYLNNLETAAIKLLQEGEEVTGNTVGQAMEISVSAPAITDYLRKNERYIAQLIDEYPNSWETIKTRFRPFVNVKEKLRRKANAG